MLKKLFFLLLISQVVVSQEKPEKVVEYYPNGKIIFFKFFKNKVKTGTWTSFYEKEKNEKMKKRTLKNI